MQQLTKPINSDNLPVMGDVRKAMEETRSKLVSIDVSGAVTEEQIFTLIMNQFQFPDLYGRNWRGMDEHLFYDPMMKVPEKLSVIGMSSLEEKNPSIASRFKEWIESTQEMQIEYNERSSK